jgi:hypothetical protein
MDGRPAARLEKHCDLAKATTRVFPEIERWSPTITNSRPSAAAAAHLVARAAARAASWSAAAAWSRASPSRVKGAKAFDPTQSAIEID